MALRTMKSILAEAEHKRVGVAMFNVLNLQMLRGVLAAAEAEQSPVILAMAEVHLPYGELELLAPILVREAERCTVPVAVHLDHGTSMEAIRRALELGFTSVMYDGSTLPYEQNLIQTKYVVELAEKYGATVEAELGHVGGGEGGVEDAEAEAALAIDAYTDPRQALDFVWATGIDALAVAIGTVHGPYRRAPKLDLQRLEEIRSAVSVPLVLHGGSGLSDEDFHLCIERGIAKINICTDLFTAAISGMEDGLARKQPYPEICRLQEQAIFEAARAKIRHFQRTPFMQR